MSDQIKSPIDCVGIVCFRGREVLLIRRGKPPRMGEWSIPGGRIEPSESDIEAAGRELIEETNVDATIICKIETVQAVFDNVIYNLHDYAAIWEGTEPIAGDDAAHAEFVNLDKITDLGMWSETVRVIEKAHQILTEKGHFK